MRFPDDVPVLTDGMVTLRAHSPADVDAVFEQCTDPVSQRWTTVPVPYTRDDAQQFVGEAVPAGWSESHWAFAVEAVDELADPGGQPRFCGTVELRDEGNRRAEIAFGAHPWARGRGIVEAALRLLLDWGFHEQRLRTVIWWANAGNWASRRAGVEGRLLLRRHAWSVGSRSAATCSTHGSGLLHVDDEQAPRGEWLTVPRLLGDRVVLRGFRATTPSRIARRARRADRAAGCGAITQPYTAETRTPMVVRVQRSVSRRGRADHLGGLADPGSDLLVGAVSAFGIKPGREAEIGYWTHPAARASGLMTEACGLVVRHCLTPYDEGGMGLVRLEAIVAEGNTASQQVVEANGFTGSATSGGRCGLRDGNLVDRCATTCWPTRSTRTLVEVRDEASLDLC